MEKKIKLQTVLIGFWGQYSTKEMLLDCWLEGLPANVDRAPYVVVEGEGVWKPGEGWDANVVDAYMPTPERRYEIVLDFYYLPKLDFARYRSITATKGEGDEKEKIESYYGLITACAAYAALDGVSQLCRKIEEIVENVKKSGAFYRVVGCNCFKPPLKRDFCRDYEVGLILSPLYFFLRELRSCCNQVLPQDLMEIYQKKRDIVELKAVDEIFLPLFLSSLRSSLFFSNALSNRMDFGPTTVIFE